MDLLNCKNYLGLSLILLAVGVVNLINNVLVTFLPQSLAALTLLGLAYVWGAFTVVLMVKLLCNGCVVEKSKVVNKTFISKMSEVFVCKNYVVLSFLVIIIHTSLALCLGFDACPAPLVDVAYTLYGGVFIRIVLGVWALFTLIVGYNQFVKKE